MLTLAPSFSVFHLTRILLLWGVCFVIPSSFGTVSRSLCYMPLCSGGQHESQIRSVSQNIDPIGSTVSQLLFKHEGPTFLHYFLLPFIVTFYAFVLPADTSAEFRSLQYSVERWIHKVSSVHTFVSTYDAVKANTFLLPLYT